MRRDAVTATPIPDKHRREFQTNAIYIVRKTVNMISERGPNVGSCGTPLSAVSDSRRAVTTEQVRFNLQDLKISRLARPRKKERAFAYLSLPLFLPAAPSRPPPPVRGILDGDNVTFDARHGARERNYIKVFPLICTCN
jgi:hypothetical protein